VHRIIFLIIYIAAFTVTSLPVTNIDTASISVLRNKFYQSVEDEDALIDFERYLDINFSGSNHPPIISAYKGAAEALKAKHAFNPFNKLKYLKSALNTLEIAASNDPYNIEIRFMRFSILHYIPGILGYSRERDEDLKIITELIINNKTSDISPDLEKGIISFLIDSDRLPSHQTAKLKALIN
jgi:hypothetical protein